MTPDCPVFVSPASPHLLNEVPLLTASRAARELVVLYSSDNFGKPIYLPASKELHTWLQVRLVTIKNSHEHAKWVWKAAMDSLDGRPTDRTEGSREDCPEFRHLVLIRLVDRWVRHDVFDLTEPMTFWHGMPWHKLVMRGAPVILILTDPQRQEPVQDKRRMMDVIDEFRQHCPPFEIIIL